MAFALCTERHDGVDNIIVVLPQRLDGFLTRHAGLCRDQVNILRLQSGVVDLLSVVIVVVVFDLAGVFRGRFALAGLGAVVATSMRIAMAGVARVGRGQLLGSTGLGRRVEIFDLGFAEDAGKRIKLSGIFTTFWRGAAYIQVLLDGDLYTSGLLITKRTYRRTSISFDLGTCNQHYKICLSTERGKADKKNRVKVTQHPHFSVVGA